VKQVVEIRSYNLKAETRQQFHRRFVEQSLPLLRRHGVDVVAYGASLDGADSYFLIRAFASLAKRRSSEDAFYGSDEWRAGLRDAVMADIESYTTVVLSVDLGTLRALRTLTSGDLAGRT
jgi:hypothetical protein